MATKGGAWVSVMEIEGDFLYRLHDNLYEIKEYYVSQGAMLAHDEFQPNFTKDDLREKWFYKWDRLSIIVLQNS